MTATPSIFAPFPIIRVQLGIYRMLSFSSDKSVNTINAYLDLNTHNSPSLINPTFPSLPSLSPPPWKPVELC